LLIQSSWQLALNSILAVLPLSDILSIIFQAVLEKQSYMLIGRHDIDKLMRIDPSSAYLPNLQGPFNLESNSYDAETIEAELELSELLLNLRPIKQVFFFFVYA
jgi:hypothetical protein